MSVKLIQLSETKLKSFVQNIIEVKNRQNTTIETKRMLPIIEVNRKFIDIISGCIENIGKTMDKETIESRIEEIVKNVEKMFQLEAEHGAEILVYNFLEGIFEQTQPIDRQHHFESLLETYYQIFQEKLDTSSNFNRNSLENLVKFFLPHLKLKIVIKQLQEGKNPLKSSILELYECLFCPKLLREDCYQIVRNKIGSNEYNLLDYNLVPILDAFGFVGNYFRLNITIKQKHEEEVLVFFAKYVPITNDPFGKLAAKTFKKEIFVYREFIPKLKSLEINDISNFAPNYFFSRSNDVVILEDMTIKDFCPHNMAIPVSYDWLVMSTKKLSQFHACSVILNAKMQENGENIGDVFGEFLEEITYKKGEITYLLGRVGAKTITDFFFEKLPDVQKKISIEEFRKTVSNEVELLFQNRKPCDKYFNVICHKDIWGGNILSEKSTDSLSDSCVFIDFQLITYCPPAVDLFFLLYVNTDKATRRQFLKNLTEMYYTNLKQNLAKYNFDLEKICSREKYLQMLNEFHSFGIIQSLLYLQIILCPGIKELNSDEEQLKKFYFVDRADILEEAWKCEPFRSRISGLIEDLYEVLVNK